MDIQEIFNKDDVLSSVEELTDLVVNEFDTIDSLILMWETQDGQIYHRSYGTSTDILGLLAKGQYIILRQTTGDTHDPHIKG